MFSFKRHGLFSGGLALAFVLLTMIGWLSFRNMKAMTEAGRWETHTHIVIRELGELLSSIKDVETGQRGFIITGEQQYLEPYHQALGQVDQHLAELRRLTRDNPRQHQRLDALAPMIRERLEIIKWSIELRATQGFAAAAQVVATGRGKQVMDQICGHVALAQAEEGRLLQERSAAKESGARKTRWSLGVGCLLGLVLFSLVFMFLWRELARRLHAEQDLRLHRDQLAELVEARTQELQELARLNAQLREAYHVLEITNAQLHASNGAWKDFAAIASHDMQEPLRKVQIIGDKLRRKYGGTLPPEAQDYLQRMMAATGRMQNLISDLLIYSHVTAKALPHKSVDLSKLVETVLADLKAQTQATGAQVEVEPLPTLDADPTQMRQLLQNLIGNALKFTPPGAAPQIRVYSRSADGGSVQILVEDQGIGFDEKYLGRIFNVFQRLEGRSAYEGTGMGLAICRKIAERHGGAITARSRPGEGATFMVTLPRVQPKAELRHAA